MRHNKLIKVRIIFKYMYFRKNGRNLYTLKLALRKIK